MAMGRRAKQRRQERLWIAHTELPQTVAHPFYEQLNRLLEERGFDEFVERQCGRFYAERMGRPSLVPGRYFRLLLIGYFEGIEGERGIAWRAADSLALRSFLGVGLAEQPPDHSTISRTRRLIDVETHQAVFRWVLELLAEKGLLKGKTNRHRCHPGGERGHAFDCATRHGGRLRGVTQDAANHASNGGRHYRSRMGSRRIAQSYLACCNESACSLFLGSCCGGGGTGL
jgi:transposase